MQLSRALLLRSQCSSRLFCCFQSVFVEAFLTGASTFLFFISILIWGGACYSSFQSADGVSVKAVGFALSIVCFFFLIICIGLILFIRRDTTNDAVNSTGFLPQHDEAVYPSAERPAATGYGAASTDYGSGGYQAAPSAV
jgi:hypothetical protein